MKESSFACCVISGKCDCYLNASSNLYLTRSLLNSFLNSSVQHHSSLPQMLAAYAFRRAPW